MTPAPIVITDLGDLARHLIGMEARIMATAAELQAGLDTLTTNVADYTSDVTAALQALKDQQTAMQATLDAALANDATDQATITDLRAQLAAMGQGVDAAMAKVTALNSAVTTADMAVDQPSTPPAPGA